MLPHDLDPIDIALAEDIGSGDLTSIHFIPRKSVLARIVSREKATVAGVEIACETFRRVDPQLKLEVVLPSGSVVRSGATVLQIRGRLPSILTAERVALNFLQRLSGVATLTEQYVKAIRGTGARILDTRKTTPGLRQYEKAAVVAGGGRNHRMGLYDMVMVKDNHVAMQRDMEGLQRAIRKFRKLHPEIRVELEADTLEQVQAYLQMDGVDVILLDNMSAAKMRKAVEWNQGRVKLEASGGINLDTVRAVAETGVDYISVGALTHSARAIDFSLEVEPPKE